jgi:hypothetical protein
VVLAAPVVVVVDRAEVVVVPEAAPEQATASTRTTRRGRFMGGSMI